MYKKKKIIPVLALIIISVGLWSCQWHTIQPVDYTPDPNDSVVDTISYSAEIQPIFDSKCVSCHINRDPRLSEATSYTSLMDGGYINTTSPETSTLYSKLKDEQHPSAGGTFSAAELAVLLQWIQQGALNN